MIWLSELFKVILFLLKYKVSCKNKVRKSFLRVRLYSRFRQTHGYQLWIAYECSEEGKEVDVDEEHVFEYYCTCQFGEGTLGSCAHISSVLWCLGIERY